ncbi:glycoside hydrolase family 35 protein [Mycena olivaceomarginata]|nr:glycoside hydrolase family 35 protein [Mycena olivaceomarginata]
MLARLLAPLLLVVSSCSAAFHEHSRRNDTGLTTTVSWDPHSLFIQGQRTFILSAEFHPWRLPGDPSIWADVLQKIKANGFNTVSFYVNWALHFPELNTNGGNGDFEANTYRDIELFMQEAKKAGLWLIARPGPYINAETTGGGFPGFVGNIAGALRTNNPNYTETWVPYMTAISKIIARNQITNGGSIILVQAENEFSAGTTQSPYMQAVIDTYRANGVVIPITHNDQHSGQAGNFSPDLPGTGRVNIYCGDSYPQGANSWAQVQSIYYSAHKAVAPSNPLCLAEFGGGFLLNWGGAPFGGTGYEKYSINPGLTNADFENVFYKENYAQTATILNIYMLFGGSNWGSIAAPVSYTSYDYGGGINENRVAGPKMNEMRLQGLFLRVSRDFLAANLLANGTNYTTSTLIHTAELRNPDTGAGFYVTRHNSSVSTELTTTQITVQTSLGSQLIPKTGALTFNGRGEQVTDYVFGISKTSILYSTAEIDKTDYIIFYAPTGQTGETSFLFESAPTMNLAGTSGVTSSFSNGTLVLSYTLNGSSFVPITLGTTRIVAVILDKPTANQWHAPIIAGPGNFGNFFSIGSNQTVLVSGPYVLRNASILSNTLFLTGDLNGTTAIEVIAPKSVSKILWNKVPVAIKKTTRGSFTGQVGGTNTISLPVLQNWKVSGSLPEIDPDFDDSNFTLADQTTTNYTNLPPLAGSQVLYSQQYGFYGGHLIFRGRFNASGQETAVNLTVQYGFAGGYSAWLNGVFLGSSQGNATISLSSDSWPIPSGTLRVGQTNVLVVFQANGGKEPRGIRGYALVRGNTEFDSWRLQGNLGGAANTPDTFRGYINEGGLWAERIGAHLPGFPDQSWASGSPLSGVSKAGINFYRTTFALPVSVGIDAPVRLSVTRSNSTTVSNFRLQIYLNGWQVGKYVNSIGPQTIFVLPASILRRKSDNTLAVMVWAMDASGAVVEGLQLISDGVFSTALHFTDYVSPDFHAQKQQRVPGGFIEPM